MFIVGNNFLVSQHYPGALAKNNDETVPKHGYHNLMLQALRRYKVREEVESTIPIDRDRVLITVSVGSVVYVFRFHDQLDL